jgi:hypothetical protein
MDGWQVYEVEGERAKHHYHACSGCAYKLDEASCQYASFEQIGDTMHRMTCAICEDVTEELHTLEWHQESGEFSGKHWMGCFCNYIEISTMGDCAVGEHGTIADCQNKAVCGTCAHSFGSPDLVNGHDFESGRYISDFNQHWKVCGNPNCVAEDIAHRENCSGGHGGCAGKAMCDVCATAYGTIVSHTFGDWTITKEPTETESGSKQRTCAGCGAVETLLIKATDTADADADGEGLTTGGKIGLIIGAGALALVAIAVAVFFILKKAAAPAAPVEEEAAAPEAAQEPEAQAPAAEAEAPAQTEETPQENSSEE